MLDEAVHHYNELLSDEALAADSLSMLQAELEAAKLIFGGRPLSPYLRPHFVLRADWDRVVRACETVFGALQKVKEAAIADEKLLDELGITDIERKLIAIDPGYAHVSPTARLDSFLVGDTYSYVELNGESPAGIAFADSASKIFRELPVMKRFSERYELTPLEGSSKLLATLVECYKEFIGGEFPQKPTIAIVDLRDLPTIKEFELFRDFFEANGYPSLICSPDELEFDGKRLSAHGREIDIVYKRLLVNEYLPIIDEEPTLLEACKARAVCMVNSFRGKLVHKKAIFGVLTNERYEHLFDDDELAVIRAHVPWTRRFRNESTRYDGAEIDLVEWTRANSQRLVLKPNDDYGGHGIYIGWNSTAEEWDAAIATAIADGDYLVQERVKTAKENFPMITGDGEWQMAEQLVDLDPLLFMGKVGSAFTRLASNELANVTAGGGMVPTFIIERK
ncbi:MAG: hypothetical protein KF756_08345 [Acidobacteria bacterium]|nr:hypothetical protein [Acidobacteriota bacterium]